MNAKTHTKDKPVYLLSVDLDSFHTADLEPYDVSAAKTFLDLSRDFFTVVHTWHYNTCYMPTNPLAHKTYMSLTPSPENSESAQMFSVMKPRKDELILGKHYESAFERTDLGTFIPQGSDICVIGAYRSVCVHATMEDGIACGFNMISINDLIYPGTHHIPHTKKTDSRAVLRAVAKTQQILSVDL